MLILMTMRGTPQENQAALTWTGWRFTSLDIVWVWSIPMCVKPLCTRGTRGISQTSSLLRMTSWEYSRFTEVSSFFIFITSYSFHFWTDEFGKRIGFDRIRRSYSAWRRRRWRSGKLKERFNRKIKFLIRVLWKEEAQKRRRLPTNGCLFEPRFTSVRGFLHANGSIPMFTLSVSSRSRHVCYQLKTMKPHRRDEKLNTLWSSLK